MAKATNIVLRRPIAPPKYPFYRISIDWFGFTKSLNGYNGYVIIKCDLTLVTKVILAEGKDDISLAIKNFVA